MIGESFVKKKNIYSCRIIFIRRINLKRHWDFHRIKSIKFERKKNERLSLGRLYERVQRFINNIEA